MKLIMVLCDTLIRFDENYTNYLIHIIDMEFRRNVFYKR